MNRTETPEIVPSLQDQLISINLLEREIFSISSDATGYPYGEENES